jgi:DNA-binding transcriptional ArsR family regulator
MPQLKSRRVIASKKQLTTLTSAARQEILGVLAQIGTVSVAELAATLGRPPDALYYHLRILLRAGLVETVGNRRTEWRQEALFRSVARDLRIDYELSRQRSEKTLTAVVSSMLRLGTRDFRNAIGNESVIVSGQHRELWAARRTGWLTKADLTRVVESIERLGQLVSQPSGRGQLCGITILLTPLRRSRNPKNTRMGH